MAALVLDGHRLKAGRAPEVGEQQEVRLHEAAPSGVDDHQAEVEGHRCGTLPPIVDSVGGAEALLHRKSDALAHSDSIPVRARRLTDLYQHHD